MSQQFSHKFHATCSAARDGIAGVMGRLQAMGLPPAAAQDVEIALAEAVNNVIEHAYCGRKGHKIAVRVRLSKTALELTLSDSGRPLPGGRVPRESCPDLDRPRNELPEGGFGWGLIHQLTDHVRYERRNGRNLLSLLFRLTGANG